MFCKNCFFKNNFQSSIPALLKKQLFPRIVFQNNFQSSLPPVLKKELFHRKRPKNVPRIVFSLIRLQDLDPPRGKHKNRFPGIVFQKQFPEFNSSPFEKNNCFVLKTIPGIQKFAGFSPPVPFEIKIVIVFPYTLYSDAIEP